MLRGADPGLGLASEHPQLPDPDASVTTTYGLDGFGYCNSGALHKACFNF